MLVFIISYIKILIEILILLTTKKKTLQENMIEVFAVLLDFLFFFDIVKFLLF